MNPKFPRNGRSYALGPVPPGNRDNSWDTGCAPFYPVCGGVREPIGHVDIPEADADHFAPLLSLTAPYPVDRWAIYAPDGLRPSLQSSVLLALPPTVFLLARVGLECCTDDVKIFQWDPDEFHEGQLIGIVATRLSTTLELWGRVEPIVDSPQGSVRVDFRFLVDRSGSSATAPVVQLGPNVV